MSDDRSQFEQFVAEVHTDEQLAGVPFVTFRLASKENDDWPRVAWIPRGGTIERSDVVGGQIVDNCRVQTPFSDKVDVEIHVWHEDFEKAELLRNCVIGSLYRLLGQRFEGGTYLWFNEQDSTAEFDVSGYKVIMNVVVDIPIGTEQALLSTVTTVTHEGKFTDSPSGSTEETVC